MPSFRIGNSLYTREHGKAPRGTGHWAFVVEWQKVQGLGVEVFYDEVSSLRTDTIFWVPGVMPLSEAKRKAVVMLRAARVSPFSDIEVAP